MGLRSGEGRRKSLWNHRKAVSLIGNHVFSQESFPELVSRVNPRQFTALCPTGEPMAKTRIHIEESPMEGKVLRTLT